jgi:hypothetical protein
MTKRLTEVSPAYEAEIVAALEAAGAAAAKRTGSEEWWERLEQYLYEALTQRRTELTAVIIKWADAGCPASHRALWRCIRRAIDDDRFDGLPVQVRAYAIRSPPGNDARPQGRAQEFLRDLWISMVMIQASVVTGIAATRSSASTKPSIGYFLHRPGKERHQAQRAPDQPHSQRAEQTDRSHRGGDARHRDVRGGASPVDCRMPGANHRWINPPSK